MTNKKRANIPRKIKGCRDIDPNLNNLRWKIINSATKIYRSYGFEHWDSPTLEYSENLGKYMPDKDTVEGNIYSFKNPELEPILGSKGEELRDEITNDVLMTNHFLSLRYDLTAPLARHYSEKLWSNYLRGEINREKPPLFRRYQFGNVFRYELKVDSGRFREFWQMDFDTVGSDSIYADAEVCMILSETLELIGLKPETYIIKVNNRKILKGFLFSIGLSDKEDAILRIMDKFDKIGIQGLKDELGEGRVDSSGSAIEGLHLDNEVVNKITCFLESFDHQISRKEVLNTLKEKIGSNEAANEGIKELEEMDNILRKLGFEENRVVFSPALVRGMAYYTGPIFEVESLLSVKNKKGIKRKIGSICGGGRYDGLVENLLGMKVPATGASIGIDRLAEVIALSQQKEEKIKGAVFIPVFDDNLMPEYQKIAQELRREGINTEIYYGKQRNLKKQLSYADKKNAPIAILFGEDELKNGLVSVKNLMLGKELTNIKDKDEWRKKVQFEVKRQDLTTSIKQMLEDFF